MFIDRLVGKIKYLNNPTVAGLDPKIDFVPKFIRDEKFDMFGETLQGASEAILEFNMGIIDSIYDIVPAVKPQLAYYEMFGANGIWAFEETVAYAKSKGMLVIADGKRNDIGSTSEAYSNAFLGETKISDTVLLKAFDADALTVNPYLGIDGIKPFIADCNTHDKGIFVLVKTSNPSSGQLQDLILADGRRIFDAVAQLVVEWGSELVGKCGYSSVGAVVGATWPSQAAELRAMMPKAYFLVPGYGAQGGTAKDIAVNFNSDGLGAIVNASRTLMCAYQSDMWKNQFSEKDYGQACRAEALRMKEDINSYIGG